MEKHIPLQFDVRLERLSSEGYDNSLFMELSAFDIPEAVTASEREGVLSVGFVYPDHEDGVSKRVDKLFDIETGRHSGKILGMTIRVEDHKIGSIKLLIERIKNEIPHLTRENQRLNYKLIQQVLEENEAKLQLVGA